MRAPDRVVRQAMQAGTQRGPLRRAAAGGHVPLVQAAPGPEAAAPGRPLHARTLDAACARALGFDLLDVRRVERILVLALEHEGQPAPPADQRVKPLPAGRFARPGTAFDHRYLPVVTSRAPVGEEPS